MSLTDQEWAAALHAEGMGPSDIARVIGRHQKTVRRWLYPEEAAKDRAHARAWKAAHREQNRARDRQHQQEIKVPCPWCPARKEPGHEMCRACRLDIAAVRRTLTEGMWADGWTCREIADAIGVETTSYISVMRSHGWDLPHRRTPEQVARITAGTRRGQGLPV